MSSQFLKRKEKAAKLLKKQKSKKSENTTVLDAQVEKKEVIEETKEITVKDAKLSSSKKNNDLPNVAFDVIIGKTGRHELVTIKYNPETMKAEIIEISKLRNRTVGIAFEQKKIALKTLTNYK